MFRKDFDMKYKVVKQENIILNDGKNYYISTVDLGINHAFGNDVPLYFETMIFKIKEDGKSDCMDLYCNRYSTRDQAKKGHEELIEKLNNGLYKIMNYGITLK